MTIVDIRGRTRRWLNRHLETTWMSVMILGLIWGGIAALAITIGLWLSSLPR